MTIFTLDGLRRISPETLDISSEFWDELQSCTFCEVEQLIRNYIEQRRDFFLASRAAGLNTRPLVEREDFSGDTVRAAIAEAHFAAGERAVRIGAQAAKVFVKEAREYAANMVARNAPWLMDAEVDGDDE